jgi:hypothetical protein
MKKRIQSIINISFVIALIVLAYVIINFGWFFSGYRIIREGDRKPYQTEGMISRINSFIDMRNSQIKKDLRKSSRLDDIINELRQWRDFQKYISPNEMKIYWKDNHLYDSWGHEILWKRIDGSIWIYSAGPNGIDEKGEGDDIPKEKKHRKAG